MPFLGTRPYRLKIYHGEIKTVKQYFFLCIFSVEPAEYNSNKVKDTKNTRESFKCTACRKVYVSQYDFAVHLNQHLEDKPAFRCSHCSVSFNCAQMLLTHLTEKHGNYNIYTELLTHIDLDTMHQT